MKFNVVFGGKRRNRIVKKREISNKCIKVLRVLKFCSHLAMKTVSFEIWLPHGFECCWNFCRISRVLSWENPRFWYFLLTPLICAPCGLKKYITTFIFFSPKWTILYTCQHYKIMLFPHNVYGRTLNLNIQIHWQANAYTPMCWASSVYIYMLQ